MKKMQMMALTFSLFFLNLVVISLPARGERRKNCGRYPVVYAVDNRKNEFKLCLVSTEYNKHGTIYRVGFPSSSADTIYKGKDGDAILQDWQGCGRGPCPPPPREYGTWKKTNQYYLFYFPRGQLYIPIP
jgi:hypothetical protein